MNKIKPLFVIILILIFLETLSRFLFPQFNQSQIVYSDNKKVRVSLGKKGFYENYINLDKNFFFRYDPDNKKEFNKNNKNIFFIGDSVTWGYGVKYENTYYSQFKKKLTSKKIIDVHAGSNMGTSYTENLDFIKKDLIKILKSNDIVVYQFNYNDITPFDSVDIKLKQDNLFNKFFKNFQRFRYKYLNHSHLIKVMGYYSSLFVNSPKGNLSCKEKGINSLGMYTYAFFSDGFLKESQNLWDNFEMKIIEVNEILTKKNIKFIVLISPISLQVKNHDNNNKYKLDLNCSKKNPHEYIISKLNKGSIMYVDPTNDFILSSEQNLTLFHPYDTNHPNKFGHKIIGEKINDIFEKNLINN